ncbi:hypothetical protein [Nitrosomonas sp.]|uniref:hypothetical protein n=1 Tax=Nitrosomonas sp. TaxID=42353 RepID=UPI001D3931B7|nr:hypothetical protein [Nitrosomonas sp.]MBX3618348.1 hypothetical protein [Nitrosomonas sp.]
MNNTQLALFVLASGRSGTSYLADFFAKNVAYCYSTHEPYCVIGNPTLFGKPIEWNTRQNDSALIPMLERKCRFVSSRKQPFYFESNHAFLKAFHRHAGTLLRNPGFVHLVRHPLKVAKSEYLRELLIRKLRLPFVDYTSDTGERLFRWTLTGEETLFQHYSQTISRFQFYLLQWLEIEYRALHLIRANHWQDRVFFIDVDVHLKKKEILRNMTRFFDLPVQSEFNLNLRRNNTPLIGPTTITEQDREEFQEIAGKLPESYRELIHSYRDCSWYHEINQLLS